MNQLDRPNTAAGPNGNANIAPEDPDRLLTFKEGFAFLSIGERLCCSLVNRGEIPQLRVGSLIRFQRSALVSWIQGQQKQARRL